MTGGTASQSPRSAVDRAARRRMTERRRRVWLNLLLFGVVLVVAVLLSMAQRDHQSVRSCDQRLTVTCQELQKMLAQGKVAPKNLPLPLPGSEYGDAMLSEEEAAADDEAFFVMRAHYFYNAHYARQSASGQRVGVCCCANAHALYLREDGRHVVLFDGENYELVWMTEEEYQRQAAELGLCVSPGK
ncbi:MAG: hypothetical protein ABIG44_05545 [Planctomycetota bacterium]